MLSDYDRDSKAFERTLTKICWYMRGGMSLDEVYQSSYRQREIINEIIKENLKITEETKLPFF